ncbi:hypothetical protein KM043_004914 [Ampulex compressa]|nr:hypothetical protein KM043_004914 [Ampulex compressa]
MCAPPATTGIRHSASPPFCFSASHFREGRRDDEMREFLRVLAEATGETPTSCEKREMYSFGRHPAAVARVTFLLRSYGDPLVRSPARSFATNTTTSTNTASTKSAGCIGRTGRIGRAMSTMSTGRSGRTTSTGRTERDREKEEEPRAPKAPGESGGPREARTRGEPGRPRAPGEPRETGRSAISTRTTRTGSTVSAKRIGRTMSTTDTIAPSRGLFTRRGSSHKTAPEFGGVRDHVTAR